MKNIGICDKVAFLDKYGRALSGEVKATSIVNFPGVFRVLCSMPDGMQVSCLVPASSLVLIGQGEEIADRRVVLYQRDRNGKEEPDEIVRIFGVLNEERVDVELFFKVGVDWKRVGFQYGEPILEALKETPGASRLTCGPDGDVFAE